jgi:hypothetical protein
VSSPIWGPWPDIYYSLIVTVLFCVGCPLWQADGFVFCISCWPLPAQSFSGPSPLVLQIWDSLFVASYDSQGHGEVFDPASTRGSPLCCLRSSLYSLGADPLKTSSLNNGSKVGRCQGNVFTTEQLPSNVHILWLQYSGFQASCNTIYKRNYFLKLSRQIIYAVKFNQYLHLPNNVDETEFKLT